MPTPSPIYTLDNCHEPTSWTGASPSSGINDRLPRIGSMCSAAVTKRDGVRVLKHRFLDGRMSQFLVSTKPEVCAARALVRSVKGRLQYLVRGEHPKAFQRNYCLRSVGSVTRETVENYVCGQPGHHPMADPSVQAVFERNQTLRWGKPSGGGNLASMVSGTSRS